MSDNTAVRSGGQVLVDALRVNDPESADLVAAQV